MQQIDFDKNPISPHDNNSEKKQSERENNLI